MLAHYNHLKFTHQELRIVGYINENPDAVLQMSAEALAKATYTSAATLNRFACKLGHKGFADFRLHYALDYQSLYEKQHPEEKNCDSHANPADYLLNMHEKLSAEHRKIANVQKQLFDRALELIINAEYIDIYATGRNYHLAMVAADKISYTGKKVSVFNNVEQDHLSRISINNRVCLLLSRTGENPTCLHAAKMLADMSVNIIALTGQQASSLKQLCPLILPVHHVAHPVEINKVTESFSISWIFDFIYLTLLNKNAEQS